MDVLNQIDLKAVAADLSARQKHEKYFRESAAVGSTLQGTSLEQAPTMPAGKQLCHCAASGCRTCHCQSSFAAKAYNHADDAAATTSRFPRFHAKGHPEVVAPASHACPKQHQATADCSSRLHNGHTAPIRHLRSSGQAAASKSGGQRMIGGSSAASRGDTAVPHWPRQQRCAYGLPGHIITTPGARPAALHAATRKARKLREGCSTLRDLHAAMQVGF